MKIFVVPINQPIVFKYYKGCQECQRFGDVERDQASAMNPIVKPCRSEVGELI
jgi:hypothetical protein